LGRSRVVFAVSRGDVVLKHLAFPASANASASDLAGMVRLQMVRQLTMTVEGTAIDFIPLDPRTTDSVARPVLAGAMPAERVDWCRRIAAAAGVKLVRIGLRSFGTAASLASQSQRLDGPVLGVAIGSTSTEFVVVDDGRMVFARAADIARPANPSEFESFADKVGIEARRTWISYRASMESREPAVAAVLADGDLAKIVAERCGAALSCRGEITAPPESVVIPAELSPSERAAANPLAGLLLEQMLGRPMLDFANPRRMPDRAARKRQLVLAGSLGLILLTGTGYVIRDSSIRSLRGQLTSLQTTEKELKQQMDRMSLVAVRARHATEWRATSVNWLAHLDAVTAAMPDRARARADEITGSLSSGVVFELGADKSPLHAKWTPRRRAVIRLTGSQDDQRSVVELRERLLTGKVYEVESSGPDKADRFGLDLVTGTNSPSDPTEKKPGPTDAKTPPSKPAPAPGQPQSGGGR
ncbi:MAG: pilus assembly protein PilM, partial [bacterium]|nr:pilus assembly protein PilM [bacterium]